jgi:hypothetical protein
MSGPRWTPKTALAGLFFCCFLAAQLIVPTLQLKAPRPARFAWQMFGGVRQPLQYELLLRDGTLLPVNLADHIGNFRSDIETAEKLPPFLCAKYSHATAVRFRFPAETATRSFPCR